MEKGEKSILEIIKVGADLQPLGRISIHVLSAEERCNYGGHPRAVLPQPVVFQDPGGFRGRHGNGGFPLLSGYYRELGEIRKGKGIYWGLLRVQKIGDGGMQLRNSHQGD